MTQKHLSIAARIVIILFAVLGLAFYGAAVPIGGLDLLKDAPELQYAYLPWLTARPAPTTRCWYWRGRWRSPSVMTRRSFRKTRAGSS